MTRTPRSLVGILIELKGYCMMTSFYCNYHNPLVCCFLCKLGSLFFKPRREIFERLPFVRKFRWKISVKWYWYVFLAPKTGTGLCFTIYKIPVNFSLSLDMKPDTSNPNKWYGKFRSFLWKRNTSKGINFFPENSHRDEPFHLNSSWNFRVFHKNGKRSRTNLNKKAKTKWILVVEVKCRRRKNGLLMKGSVSYKPSSTTDITPFAASHSRGTKPLESKRRTGTRQTKKITI